MIALMPRAYIIELLTDLFKARRRPKYGSSEQFWATLQRRIDTPPPPDEPYVAPCRGTGNHSDPSWPWYQDDQDDYESPFARATRLKEEKERARAYGWDKLERPTSIVEPRYASNHIPEFHA